LATKKQNIIQHITRLELSDLRRDLVKKHQAESCQGETIFSIV